MTKSTDWNVVHSDEENMDDEGRPTEWRSRPWLARAVRVGILGVPFLVVILLAWRINGALGPPGSVIEAVARWAALSVFSTIALLGIDRSARYYLPIATLLQLSLVFPDQAPSRFKVALRQGTAKRLAAEASRLESASAQEAAEFLLTVVGQLTAHDRLTRGHTERVRAYADLIATEMGLTDDERMRLQWAGLLHDVGKLTVPTDVLNKVTKLSDREWSRLRTHPGEGWKMIEPMRGWLGEWARATRDHHERWDGMGYPRGISGTEISRAGRIIAVADAFDVMTTVRSYKTAMTHEDARAELARHSGTQFDPDVVRAFLGASLAPRQRGKVGTWLANSPVALQATSVSQVPAAVTSAVAVALAASTIVIPALDAEHPETAAERIVEEVVVTTSAPPTTTTSTTTTTTTTTTTSAPASTTSSTTSPVAPVTAPPPPPTPTSPPVTTTTAPAVVAEVPTTTTIPPSTFAGGFLGAGSGGSTFGLLSAVSGAGATNWDSGTNADPGLTLTSGPSGLIEIDAPYVTAWSLSIIDETRLAGNASLRLHVATPGYSDASLGGITAGLVDCVNLTTNCTTISSGSAVFSQTDFGSDFGAVTINLGAIDHTIDAGHTLLVSMTVPQSMPTDTWLAFGTSTYPSRFRLT